MGDRLWGGRKEWGTGAEGTVQVLVGGAEAQVECRSDSGVDFRSQVDRTGLKG